MSYKAIFHSSKNFIFLTKIYDIFLHIASIIDCGWSLESPCRALLTKYLQSMFWRTKKIIYIPVNPTLLYIKLGFQGIIFREVLM